MTAIVLTRAASEADAKPGQWWTNLAGVDRPRWVSIRCPQCERGLSIVRDYENPMGTHHVAVDGIVAPSVVCTHPGCTWHVFIRLEGWPG